MTKHSKFRIGIDIGGTFTDLCLMHEDGSLRTGKILTTPDDPSVCFLQILDDALQTSYNKHAREIVHATTIVTNALLEENTASMGMITTRGFRDVLEIGRHFRRDLYNFFLEKPPPLISRQNRLEIDERLSASGEVIRPVDPQQVRDAAKELVNRNVEVIVVAFLHSYAWPEHEIKAAELIGKCTDIPVIMSHSLCREYREYERFSTAAVHGAVTPLVSSYLNNIKEGLRKRELHCPLSVMQSSGGIAHADTIVKTPASIVESGPAAGVIASVEIGKRVGHKDLICFDMGGTTAKCTLVHHGKISLNYDFEVGGGLQGGFGTGYALRTPSIDLVEIGTGGGSICTIDDSGHLKVGPKSAGANPGPVCYSFGGTEPTVTDANAVLGRFRKEYFAMQRLQLDVQASRKAIEEKIARPLGMSLHQAAEGVLALANAQMVRILQVVSIERGFDPRDFTMLAFGGAGPLHAADLAKELGCPRVIIPPEAGVQSAWGLLVADAQRDRSHPILKNSLELDLAELKTLINKLEKPSKDELLEAGFAKESIRSNISLDGRYPGQAFEVNVPHPSQTLSGESMRALRDSFHQYHERLYGYANKDSIIEWVTLRVSVVFEVAKPVPKKLPGYSSPLSDRVYAKQEMTFSGSTTYSPVYLRSSLCSGDIITGPALIIQDQTTISVPPNVVGEVREYGDIVLDILAA